LCGQLLDASSQGSLEVSKLDDKLASNEIRDGGYINVVGGLGPVYAPYEAYLARNLTHGQSRSVNDQFLETSGIHFIQCAKKLALICL
jgi:hypothetical protein